MNNNSIQIERYLQNEMTVPEKLLFESQLATDKELQQELRIQQQIVTAAINAGIKNEFKKSIQRKILNQRLLQWGVILAIAVAAFLFYAIKNNIFSHARIETETKVVAPEKFEINTASDTIIETKDGVVFAIPAGAFNSNGANIQLEIKTALNAYDIMKNGLSTMSNDAMLQTAGMFYINGYENGKAVALVKDIAVSVPANEINPAMQLFDGAEDTDGHINWVNPKPVEKRLRTYNITTLDFYPPGYIPVLKALNKDYKNKRYTDSLYYSFSGGPQRPAESINNSVEYEVAKPDTEGRRLSTQLSDSGRIPLDYSNTDAALEIDPAKIRAISDKQFNNTIIATKEFEERLRFMHGLCTDKYLNIYLKNLNLSLYKIDQICADRSNGDIRKEFLDFAARKDGGALIADGMQQKLSTYFQQKSLAFQEAAVKTWTKYEAELSRLNNIADKKRREQAVNDATRDNNNFREEFCINLANAYEQIGIDHTCNDTIPPANKYYNVTISTTGWKNLDVYVAEATANRQDMTYTDPVTGKTAIISYKPVSMQITDQQQYDKVLVYLIPDSLSSFQQVWQEGNMFNENLNSLFRYDAVVIAYKGEKIFYHKERSLQPANYVFNLLPVTEASLRTEMKTYAVSKAPDLITEFNYQFFEQQEMMRLIKLRKEWEFRQQVGASIFHCIEGNYYPSATSTR